MISMPPSKIAHAIDVFCPSPLQDQYILRVVIDSRIVQPGDLFFAIRGERFNGHDFITEATKQGATALFRASQRGHEGVVHTLLAKGADVNAKTKDGATALDAAKEVKQKEVILLLKQAGAKE